MAPEKEYNHRIPPVIVDAPQDKTNKQQLNIFPVEF
jgi:hypothetical protein